MLPPVVLAIESSVATTVGSGLVVSPFVPMRPFASATGGGVVNDLDLYTQEGHIAFTFNATATEAYVGNGATRFECSLLDGATVVLPAFNCTSPVVFDNTTLRPSASYTTTVADGTTVFRGGAYTFRVVPMDAAGNTGDPSTFTWIVDVAPPRAVVVPETQPWVNGSVLLPIFVATEPGCSFECQLAFVGDITAHSAAAVTHDPIVVVPFYPCALSTQQLVLIFEPQGSESGVTGRDMAMYLQAVAPVLQASLGGQLAPYVVSQMVLDVAVDQGVERARVTFDTVLPAGTAGTTASLHAMLSALATGTLRLRTVYTGVSMFEVADAITGVLCTCATCNGSTATCVASNGTTYVCPCVGSYAGTSTLSLHSFAYQQGLPASEHVSIPPAYVEPMDDDQYFRTFLFSVRPTDAGGVVGAVTTQPFYVDARVPDTGVSHDTGAGAHMALISSEYGGNGTVSLGGFLCRVRTRCAPSIVSPRSECTANTSTEVVMSTFNVTGGVVDTRNISTGTWYSCAGNAGAAVGLDKLPDGEYMFDAAARDKAGNIDSTPALIPFSVAAALQAPTIHTVLQGRDRLVFSFSSGARTPNMLYRCRVNASTDDIAVQSLAQWHPCVSPYVVAYTLPVSAMTMEVAADTSTDTEPEQYLPARTCARVPAITMTTNTFLTGKQGSPDVGACRRYDVAPAVDVSPAEALSLRACAAGVNTPAVAMLVAAWIVLLTGMQHTPGP